MSVEAWLAVVGVLFTAITAIPIMKDLISPGSEREKRLALFAQEILAGTSDDEKRTYWTNARNHALRQVEAHQAFPTGRKMTGLGLVVIGVVFWFFAGTSWLHLIEQPGWRSLVNGPQPESLSAPLLAIFGSISFHMSTIYQHRMGAEKSKISGRRNPAKGKRYLYARHFGLAFTANALGLITSATFQAPPGTMQVIAIMYFVSLAIGVALSFYSWSNMKQNLAPEARSDVAFLRDESKEQDLPKDSWFGYL